jgi:transposase-like protein
MAQTFIIIGVSIIVLIITLRYIWTLVCPKCYSFSIEELRKTLISSQEKYKTETKQYNGNSYDEKVKYIRSKYMVAYRCKKCKHTWERKDEDWKKA